jgi:hypothetical protein
MPLFSFQNLENAMPQKCVYLIKSGQFYKIGSTGNLTSRLKQFKTGNPDVKLICFWETENFRELEKRLHKMLWEFRLIDRKEWFDLPEEAIAFLKSCSFSN